ncbi:hypothetical protein G6O69_29035 [Pseudenhygromyxa sp. WMMC2535]|uniref:immunity protein Imm33 domain-containing protein n=1 Tax=Pseudenhygromyxa sp. WMMC2535 TaxID=2712867 RepID=UPI001552F4DC|nr:hypothetical protein [Pseudenhygromyxa sp. WMMC2535]NVB41911.1 hypothetical protein [Pseudenhygromyxa sp. WMMC2535]
MRRELVLAVAALLLAPACKRERSRSPEGAAGREAGSGAGPTGLQEPGSGADEYVLPYGERRVYAYADPGLAGEIDRLFLLLEDLRAESVEISARTHLPIGWTTLTFSVEGSHGERLIVHEPDYDANPEAQTRTDISVSLATLARQRRVLEEVGVAGEAIDFDEHVLAIAGAIDLDDVLLLRVASPGGRMTGWRLVPAAGIAEADELESLPVHEILLRRPALLDAMLLPSGYMVYYSGEAITAVVNERDELVWDGAGEARRDTRGLDDQLGRALEAAGQSDRAPPEPGDGALLPPLRGEE